MSATPEHSNLQAVGRGSNNALPPIEVPGRQAHHMLAKHDIGLRESLKQPVVNHCLRALRRLFPWLKDCHERSVPAIAALGKQRGGPYQAGHVHVVPAGVRHGRGFPIWACRCNCTGV